MEETLILLLIGAMFVLGHVTIQNVLMRQRQRAVYDFMMMLRGAFSSDLSVNESSEKNSGNGELLWFITLLVALLFLLWLLPLTV